MFIKVIADGSTDIINMAHVKALRWAGTGEGQYRVLFIDGDDVFVHIDDDEIARLTA